MDILSIIGDIGWSIIGIIGIYDGYKKGYLLGIITGIGCIGFTMIVLIELIN